MLSGSENVGDLFQMEPLQISRSPDESGGNGGGSLRVRQ